MIYLFIGEDEIAKKEKLQEIKRQSLNPASADFNYELLYAKELNLPALQEVLSRLPINSPKRIAVIKDATKLSEKIKDFLINYAKNPAADIILLLDISRRDALDPFLKAIAPYTKAVNFHQAVRANTFKLCDELERKMITPALKMLHQLFLEGEKPERILGGLRYRWERDCALSARERTRRLNLLLNCDRDIKRGRLRPEFSLEKLLISLCCFQ